jgi:Immunity protein 49
MSVARHRYPADAASDGVASLDKTADWVLERIERSEVARAQALGVMLSLATTRCATDPEASRFETWEAWVMAMQAGSALFAAATAPEATSVTVRIREQKKVLPATGPQSHVNAGTWVTSFYLAMICRENQRLQELAQVPVSLLPSPPTRITWQPAGLGLEGLGALSLPAGFSRSPRWASCGPSRPRRRDSPDGRPAGPGPRSGPRR